TRRSSDLLKTNFLKSPPYYISSIKKGMIPFLIRISMFTQDVILSMRKWKGLNLRLVLNLSIKRILDKHTNYIRLPGTLLTSKAMSWFMTYIQEQVLLRILSLDRRVRL